MKEVIVVEGKNDTQAIQRAVEADTIETNGSAIPDYIICEIKRACLKRGVIVFTDPDAAGDRIRRVISEKVPEVKHAFLPRSQAKKQQKIGIEFAKPEAIVQALRRVRVQLPVSSEPNRSPVSWEEYFQEGFSGRSSSAQLRERVAEQLGIGYGNAKQFFKRLSVLNISREEFYQALETVKKDDLDESEMDFS